MQQTALEIIKTEAVAKRAKASYGDMDTFEKFEQAVISAVNKDPKLAACSASSFGACYMQAAQIGLMPNTIHSHAHLIPRGNECTLLIDYKGMIYKAYKSGLVLEVIAEVVFSNDEFNYSFRDGVKWSHTPARGERGEREGAYATFRLKAGGQVFKYLSKEAIESVRPPHWQKTKTWASKSLFVVDEMWKKTAVRNAFKYAQVCHDVMHIEEMEQLGKKATLDVLTGELSYKEPQRALGFADEPVEAEAEVVEPEETK